MAAPGPQIVDLLLARGRDVRALVRTDDERAASLRRHGAATVVADLTDRASLAAAINDVSVIYFTHPVGPGVIPAAANLASVLVDYDLRLHRQKPRRVDWQATASALKPEPASARICRLVSIFGTVAYHGCQPGGDPRKDAAALAVSAQYRCARID